MIHTRSAHSKFPKRNRGLGVGQLHVSITKRGPSRERSGFPLAWNKHKVLSDRVWVDAHALVLLSTVSLHKKLIASFGRPQIEH
jgi:hypothetical protein